MSELGPTWLPADAYGLGPGAIKAPCIVEVGDLGLVPADKHRDHAKERLNNFPEVLSRPGHHHRAFKSSKFRYIVVAHSDSGITMSTLAMVELCSCSSPSTSHMEAFDLTYPQAQVGDLALCRESG